MVRVSPRLPTNPVRLPIDIAIGTCERLLHSSTPSIRESARVHFVLVHRLRLAFMRSTTHPAAFNIASRWSRFTAGALSRSTVTRFGLAVKYQSGTACWTKPAGYSWEQRVRTTGKALQEVSPAPESRRHSVSAQTNPFRQGQLLCFQVRFRTPFPVVIWMNVAVQRDARPVLTDQFDSTSQASALRTAKLKAVSNSLDGESVDHSPDDTHDAVSTTLQNGGGWAALSWRYRFSYQRHSTRQCSTILSCVGKILLIAGGVGCVILLMKAWFDQAESRAKQSKDDE